MPRSRRLRNDQCRNQYQRTGSALTCPMARPPASRSPVQSLAADRSTINERRRGLTLNAGRSTYTGGTTRARNGHSRTASHCRQIRSVDLERSPLVRSALARSPPAAHSTDFPCRSALIAQSPTTGNWNPGANFRSEQHRHRTRHQEPDAHRQHQLPSAAARVTNNLRGRSSCLRSVRLRAPARSPATTHSLSNPKPA